MTNPDEFANYLAEPEGARLEFKAARNHYGFDELIRYSVALANEGGGKLILGVTDQRPRNVVGTNAFPDPGQTEASIYGRLGRRVSIEISHVPSLNVLMLTQSGFLHNRFAELADPERLWRGKGCCGTRSDLFVCDPAALILSAT